MYHYHLYLTFFLCIHIYEIIKLRLGAYPEGAFPCPCHVLFRLHAPNFTLLSHPPPFHFFVREKKKKKGDGRHHRQRVQGREGVLEEEGVQEAKRVGPEEKEPGGAWEHPNREGSVLEVEDQTRTQDPNQENPIAEEDGAVGSGRVREDDAGPGQLADHDCERLSFGLRWDPRRCGHVLRWVRAGPSQGVRREDHHPDLQVPPHGAWWSISSS